MALSGIRFSLLTQAPTPCASRSFDAAGPKLWRLPTIWLQRSQAMVYRLALLSLPLLLSGCMSLSTNSTILSDSSHLGTPYSGTRANLHILVCFSRDVSRDASGLLFAPLMLFPIVDLPLSAAVDTLLLPIDLPLEPDRPAQQIAGGGCRLIGM